MNSKIPVEVLYYIACSFDINSYKLSLTNKENHEFFTKETNKKNLNEVVRAFFNIQAKHKKAETELQKNKILFVKETTTLFIFGLSFFALSFFLPIFRPIFSLLITCITIKGMTGTAKFLANNKTLKEEVVVSKDIKEKIGKDYASSL